jgi:hypothetical protein
MRKISSVLTAAVLVSTSWMSNAEVLSVPVPVFSETVASALPTNDLVIQSYQESTPTLTPILIPESDANPLLPIQGHSSGGKIGSQAQSSLITPLNVPVQYSFTNCTPFTLGNGLYATLTAPNQVKCFNTYSATDIKIVAQATGQPAGVNYDIFVYYYNDATSTTEFKSSSVALGNVDEYAAAKMPGGNYLIYVQATSGSSATSFVVGAIGYTAFDQHEANDDAAYATAVSGNQVVTGNTDYAGDIDYFKYTTASDQVQVNLTFQSTNHALQYYTGSSWITLTGTKAQFSAVGSSTYYFRILNAVTPNNTAVNYTLALTRPVVSLGNPVVSNDENLPNVGWGTEAVSRLTFTGYAADKNSQVVPYGVVRLIAYTMHGTFLHDYQTGADGQVDHKLNFTPCTGGGYYGVGAVGRVNPPSFWYEGMAESVGFFQLCQL